MSFKSKVDEDIFNIFLNTKEFAETHTVEGNKISCVVDSQNFVQLQNEVSSFTNLDIVKGQMILFAHENDLPSNIKKGQAISVDDKAMTVVDVKNDIGFVMLTLSDPQSF